MGRIGVPHPGSIGGLDTAIALPATGSELIPSSRRNEVGIVVWVWQRTALTWLPASDGLKLPAFQIPSTMFPFASLPALRSRVTGTGSYGVPDPVVTGERARGAEDRVVEAELAGSGEGGGVDAPLELGARGGLEGEVHREAAHHQEEHEQREREEENAASLVAEPVTQPLESHGPRSPRH